jgi:hypothetical protein
MPRVDGDVLVDEENAAASEQARLASPAGAGEEIATSPMAINSCETTIHPRRRPRRPNPVHPPIDDGRPQNERVGKATAKPDRAERLPRRASSIERVAGEKNGSPDEKPNISMTATFGCPSDASKLALANARALSKSAKKGGLDAATRSDRPARSCRKMMSLFDSRAADDRLSRTVVSKRPILRRLADIVASGNPPRHPSNG